MSHQQFYETVQREQEYLEMSNIGVYAAINKVQFDLAKEGISKDRRNQSQGYQFRGIDDVYNSLSPLLAKHGLCILPRIISRVCEERQTSKGGVLFYVTVEAEFDFVCAADGSKHVIRTFGEAMDSGDKATNKAMSAAYKYAAFQAFAIPTEGDNDADSHTHQPAPRHTPTQGAQVSPERSVELVGVASHIVDAANSGDIDSAYLQYAKIEDTEEKVFVWNELKAHSSIRAAIKAHGEKLKGQK